MLSVLMFSSSVPVAASNEYVKVQTGDTFAYNYNISYKNGTLSTGIAYLRVNAVENYSLFYAITWNQTTFIIFSGGFGINITDIVPSNASMPLSLVPFINENVVNKSLHQVGNGINCRASWDADGVLFSLNATMNATAPGPVASQVISLFQRRSLLSGYGPDVIVAFTIPAIAIIGIKIKREMRR